MCMVIICLRNIRYKIFKIWFTIENIRNSFIVLRILNLRNREISRPVYAHCGEITHTNFHSESCTS